MDIFIAMNEIIIYHNPRCKKSREALTYLTEKTINPTLVFYLKNPFTVSSLKILIKKIGCKPIALLRTEETLWKSNYKNKTLSDDALVNLLVENPKLIQRPIVATDKSAVIARPIENLVHFLKLN